MAQSKKPASGARKPGAARPGTSSPASGRPPARRPGKSIVNQKQTPWALIVTSVVIVIFAAGIVTYALTRGKSAATDTNRYTLPELAAAKKIPGLLYKVEPNHTHVPGVITYNTSPPTGGDHSQYWADCTGTVYPDPIANENAVHMLEHGAVWVTYRPGLPADQLATLEKYVKGQMWSAMSPYPGLKAAISLQVWNYQLFVDNANDPRISDFIGLLRHNDQIVPEPGATCSQPTFIQHPSTPGHPLWAPASGASGATMP
ncbi:MAG: DUF3105 domain-containing protein [Jatrophihabitans sp.]|nr:MAG: DUF3105 domain-containing protein [Jatrophihabitans sp.]